MPALPVDLLLTCEHASRRIPRAYAPLFRGAEEALASHRGWDPGALELTRRLARTFDVTPVLARWSRLLVELNRSLGHPRLFSEFSRDLPPPEHQRLLERYYLPHRQAVEQAVAARIATGMRVIHVGVHSFTPQLDGVERRADVGLLYDPACAWERRLCVAWQRRLGQLEPALRVRRNYPYLGKADGLTTALRREFGATRYAGIELEVNQRFVGGAQWDDLCRAVAESAVATFALPSRAAPA
jgi:predicted N-formylglutamate amidohydrolase